MPLADAHQILSENARNSAPDCICKQCQGAPCNWQKWSQVEIRARSWKGFIVQQPLATLSEGGASKDPAQIVTTRTRSHGMHRELRSCWWPAIVARWCSSPRGFMLPGDDSRLVQPFILAFYGGRFRSDFPEKIPIHPGVVLVLGICQIPGAREEHSLLPVEVSPFQDQLPFKTRALLAPATVCKCNSAATYI